MHSTSGVDRYAATWAKLDGLVVRTANFMAMALPVHVVPGRARASLLTDRENWRPSITFTISQHITIKSEIARRNELNVLSHRLSAF
jgi:hypothetical protein